MAETITIKDRKGKTCYPVTAAKAVFDSNGKDLESLVGDLDKKITPLTDNVATLRTDVDAITPKTRKLNITNELTGACTLSGSVTDIQSGDILYVFKTDGYQMHAMVISAIHREDYSFVYGLALNGKARLTAVYLQSTMGNLLFQTVYEAPMTIMERTETTATILPEVLNRWGEVVSLTIDFAPARDGTAAEYCIEFTSGATPTTLSLPASVKFPDEPTIEANMRYQISVVNDLGLIAGVEL